MANHTQYVLKGFHGTRVKQDSTCHRNAINVTHKLTVWISWHIPPVFRFALGNKDTRLSTSFCLLRCAGWWSSDDFQFNFICKVNNTITFLFPLIMFVEMLCVFGYVSDWDKLQIREQKYLFRQMQFIPQVFVNGKWKCQVWPSNKFACAKKKDWYGTIV